MENKILTLPIGGRTGNLSTIQRFKENMETLLDAAENLFQDGLMKDINDDPDIAINIEAWKRYKKIVYGFLAAEETGCNLICIRYAEAPSMVNNFSSVTITLPKVCSFTSDEKTALTIATLLSNRISTETKDAKTQITFTVDNFWMDGGM